MDSPILTLAQTDPYSLDKSAKYAFFAKALDELTTFHYQQCQQYQQILNCYQLKPDHDLKPEQQPMLPIRLFKEIDLLSVPKDQIVKIMTSSGTSGQSVSKIYLDKKTSLNQSKVLTHIISSFIGSKRLPLLVLDASPNTADRVKLSARRAGIIGFSSFGYDTTFALTDNMDLNLDKMEPFFLKHKDSPILLFGYTSIIWQHIISILKEKKIFFNLKEAILFHIGGWKKIEEQAVNHLAYNEAIKEAFGGVTIHNYYGMTEQLGSVYVECEHGNMHCSNYSDIFIRRPADFSIAKHGETGLLELLSLLPTSYPGHIILTEDEGMILGEDDCPCGRFGKYFKIKGRIKGAEIRGCSDTYERR